MAISGDMILAGAAVRGDGASFRAIDPAAGADIEPAFACATLAQLDQACAAADAAFVSFRSCAPAERATFLDAIGAALREREGAIIERALLESGLPRGRLEGELGRTINQLAMFARTLRDGTYLDLRIDAALPDRSPPRSDLRLSMVPLGPLAVFGASNFPLAFSVAGGDTASALAAGCPVVVKAHSSHPGTSELVAQAICEAANACGLPGGVFSMVFGDGRSIGTALVGDRRIQAVGFTGSRQGGLALVAAAQARTQPIPVYAEMSSINPVLLLPGALAENGAAIGASFAAAVTLGSGQFCTNPGLLVAIDGPEVQHFVEAATQALSAMAGTTMLNEGIYRAYSNGVAALKQNTGAKLVAEGAASDGWVSRPALFSSSAAAFLADPALHAEVFGAAALLVLCNDADEFRQVIAAVEGQLTVSVHAHGPEDMTLAADLMPLLERKAGRILFGGFGTGVEVCDAMVHGGPFPATSDVRSTSVGSLAIARFLRPVCYQDVPDALLPQELRAANPAGLPRTSR